MQGIPTKFFDKSLLTLHAYMHPVCVGENLYDL